MKKITALVFFSLLPCFIHTMQHSQEISSSELNDIPEGLDVLHAELERNGTTWAFLYNDGTLLVTDTADKTGELLIDTKIAENPEDVIRLEFSKDGTKVLVITPKGSEEFSYKK